MDEKRHSYARRSRASQAAPLKTRSSPRANLPLIDRIRGILTTRNLTLADIAQQSRALFPDNPRYHVPHNFYFQLSTAGLSPLVHQLVTLSHLTRYRLTDWLAVFGFRLDEIPRLQIALRRERTALLDSNVYDTSGKISWFRERPLGVALPPVAPFSQLLESASARHPLALLTSQHHQFLYAKVGRQDAFAFPELLPNSIVRANTRHIERLLAKSNGQISKHLFLVEFGNGLCCCRLYMAGKNRITLIASQLPFARVELRLGTEARVLGVLDLELRTLKSKKPAGQWPCPFPEVAPNLAKLWKPSALPPSADTHRPGILLRNARLRAGLSFRDAAEMSREVANALGDRRYFTSPGAFSDYEATNTLPRRIHKLFTLCIVYSIAFADLLSSYGLALNDIVSSPIPEAWIPADSNTVETETTGSPAPDGTGFLASLLTQLGAIPFFLRNSLDALSGMGDVSLRDAYWVGGQKQSLHPSMNGAMFVIVNHRRKKPIAYRRKPPWEQPLYLLAKRDGSYLASSCHLEDSKLVVHPYTEGFIRPEVFRNYIDAEVVGQIVTIVRSLSPSE